jgi:hypothetical protein
MVMLLELVDQPPDKHRRHSRHLGACWQAYKGWLAQGSDLSGSGLRLSSLPAWLTCCR